MADPFLQKLLHYKLDGRRAVACESVEEWKEWRAKADRRVAETWIDDICISTVFLGLDHNPLPDSDPALFETMVFANDADHQMRRYFIWEEAEAGHAEMVSLIREEMEDAQVKATAALAALMERMRPASET